MPQLYVITLARMQRMVAGLQNISRTMNRSVVSYSGF